MAKHIGDEQRQAIWRALGDGRDVNTVATALGHDWKTVRKERTRIVQAGVASLLAGSAAPLPPPDPAAERREVRDAAYWQRQARALRRELADAEHVAAELAGVRGQSFTIPEWLISTRQGRRGKSAVGLFLSDIHADEVIKAEETLGINAYDLDICAARLKRYFEAAVADLCEAAEAAGWTALEVDAALVGLVEARVAMRQANAEDGCGRGGRTAQGHPVGGGVPSSRSRQANHAPSAASAAARAVSAVPVPRLAFSPTAHIHAPPTGAPERERYIRACMHG